jgi:hypothetical protein
MIKEVYRITCTFLISSTLTGLIFGFKFFEAVEVQLHDTYVIFFPIYSALFVWIIFTFIVYLVWGLKTRFGKIASTWILLLTNSILAALTILFTYWLYVFFISDMLFDVFRQTKRVEVISHQFYFSIATCITLAILFLAGEFFLVKRLISLNRVKDKSRHQS